MKERTKNAFKKLAEITCGKCSSCPVGEKFRCCDKMFCGMVEQSLKAKGITLEKPNVGGIPYMSEKGCVVPPELRPYCTGFVCTPHFTDRNFRREYDRLIEKIGQDPEAPKMPNIMRGMMHYRKKETGEK